MKHASRILNQPLQVRIRRLGFNPGHLTATEQEELVALEEILSSGSPEGRYMEPDTVQKLLVSP